MVLGVCRRAVRDEQAAEDAFQATFLVLAIKAGSIRRHESLGPWLHGVAARIARRARVRACRRARASLDALSLATIPGEFEEPEADAAELRAVLDEEIERLPAAYRRAVVLCYLEGKTQEAAALELGWTKGTVSGRLARAKDLLRARLTRRGFAPSAGLTGIFLAGEEARSAVPAAMTRDAVRAGLNAVLGRTEVIAASGAVAALAGGVLRTMMLGKLAAIVAALVVLITVSSTLARTAVEARAQRAPLFPRGSKPPPGRNRRRRPRSRRRPARGSRNMPVRGSARPGCVTRASWQTSPSRRTAGRWPRPGGMKPSGSGIRRPASRPRMIATIEGAGRSPERRVFARRHEAGRRPRRFPSAPGSLHGQGNLPYPGPQGRRARDRVLSRWAYAWPRPPRNPSPPSGSGRPTRVACGGRSPSANRCPTAAAP